MNMQIDISVVNKDNSGSPGGHDLKRCHEMRQDLCLRGSLLQARKCLITLSICAATFAAARNLNGTHDIGDSIPFR